jgi:hypothetical protein
MGALRAVRSEASDRACRDAVDFDGLRAARRASADTDRSAWHIQSIGQESHERFIRGTVDRGSVKSNSKGAVGHADDLIGRRTWLEPYLEAYAFLADIDRDRAHSAPRTKPESSEISR